MKKQKVAHKKTLNSKCLNGPFQGRRCETKVQPDKFNVKLANLFYWGYMLVPLDVDDLESKFDETITNMPEMQNVTDDNHYVGGGFSALGNSSSFHNGFVREVRNRMYGIFKNKLKEHGYLPHVNLELLIDRMMYRPKNIKVPSETYHYDTTPENNPYVSAHPDDVIIGGWVNCNSQPQHFICVPGEIIGDRGKGFTKLSKEQSETFKKREIKVVIPRGHAILFHQNLVHRIAGNATNFDLKRVFVGFRLTNDEKPLINNIEGCLTYGSVVPLKSGQLPPMWPKMYEVCHKDKLKALSDSFPDCMKDRNGILHRFAQSLIDLKYPLNIDIEDYRYSRDEKKLYYPQPLI
jgi:hypothetical protein